MNLKTFKIGGIHPPEGKKATENKPIEIIMPKTGALMVYPMSQHIGAPATPLVKKGDRVLMGQDRRSRSFYVFSHSRFSIRYCQGYKAYAYSRRNYGTFRYC